MKNFILSVAVFGAVSAFGAEDNQEQQKQLETRIEKLGQYAEKFDTRIKNLTDQAKRIDKRSELIVNNSLKLFSNVKDSRETGSKVIRNKKKIIQDLHKNIKLYEGIRAEVGKKMKVSGLTYGKEFVNYHKWLENRVSVRIEQVMKMTKSFEGYKDSYDKRYDSYNNNRDRSVSKDRKKAKKGDLERGKVVDEMNKAIMNLQNRITGYEKEMASTTSNKKVLVLTTSLEADYKKIRELESTIQDILEDRTGTKKIGKKEEKNLSKQLNINIKELRANMDSMKSLSRSIIELADKRARLRYDTKKAEWKLDKITE